MNIIGEELNPVKINYEMRAFKTDIRRADAKATHPLKDTSNGRHLH
jgi:hypothetical protein